MALYLTWFKGHLSISTKVESSKTLSPQLRMLDVYMDLLMYVEISVSKNDYTAETTIERRRVFVAKAGYMGIGPIALVEGGICCILFGARVPYILRSLEDKTYISFEKFYLYCIMLGEAFDMHHEENKFEEQNLWFVRGSNIVCLIS